MAREKGEAPTTEEMLRELTALAVENRARLDVALENQARILAQMNDRDPSTMKGAIRQDVKMMEQRLQELSDSAASR